MKQLLILPFFLLLIYATVVDADTIYLKDGQELKGVVVEDYNDRIILSTEKGETSFLKKDIEKISYEIPEENLVKLGAFYKDKGDYKRALYYYEVAYKLNPNMNEARDGVSLLSNMIFRKRESDLEKQVVLRQDIEEKMGKSATEENTAQALDIAAGKAKELKAHVGISIESVGPHIKVSKVLKGSPADEAGVREGDSIISIWGKLIKYMQPKDIYDLFLNSEVSEIRITGSRDISLILGKNHLLGGAEERVGARLKVELEGLTVDQITLGGPVDKAGILKGDRITKISNSSTRYMPFESACKLIEGTKGDSINLEIQREFIIWKKG